MALAPLSTATLMTTGLTSVISNDAKYFDETDMSPNDYFSNSNNLY